MTLSITLAVLAAALTISTPTAPAQATRTADETAVLATMEQFFAAMTARDVEKMSSLALPEAMTFSQSLTKDGPKPLRKAALRENLAVIAKGGPVLRERLRDPLVMVHPPIAVIWSAYEVHADNAFSHCGIDIFELMKVEGTWKISNASWTAETDGCEKLSSAAAPADADKRAVLGAVERMTAAMRTRDIKAYASTLVPEGMSFGTAARPQWSAVTGAKQQGRRGGVRDGERGLARADLGSGGAGPRAHRRRLGALRLPHRWRVLPLRCRSLRVVQDRRRMEDDQRVMDDRT